MHADNKPVGQELEVEDLEPPRYDERKFGELLKYLAERSATDPYFGDTKLNKLLFFCDFLSYAHRGEPITGAVYQRLRHGPAPRRLLPVRRDLIAKGEVEVTTVGRYVRQRRTLVNQPADVTMFESDEIALIDEVLDLLSHADSETVSELSHRVSAGWNLVDEQDDIPYETALISMREPPPEALEMGRQLAERYGW